MSLSDSEFAEHLARHAQGTYHQLHCALQRYVAGDLHEHVPELTRVAGDCSTLTPGSLRWSKISQGGLLKPGGNGHWVTDDLITNGFTSSLTIPRNLKAGNYVLRHEIIALHAAGNDNGAQFYPQVGPDDAYISKTNKLTNLCSA
jgi:hypothetical protein